MVNPRGVAKKSGPAAGDERDLDATVRWLRGLSTDEIGKLREAIDKHDAESLALFAIRFATCLDLGGRP